MLMFEPFPPSKLYRKPVTHLSNKTEEEYDTRRCIPKMWYHYQIAQVA